MLFVCAVVFTCVLIWFACRLVFVGVVCGYLFCSVLITLWCGLFADGVVFLCLFG